MARAAPRVCAVCGGPALLADSKLCAACLGELEHDDFAPEAPAPEPEPEPLSASLEVVRSAPPAAPVDEGPFRTTFVERRRAGSLRIDTRRRRLPTSALAAILLAPLVAAFFVLGFESACFMGLGVAFVAIVAREARSRSNVHIELTDRALVARVDPDGPLRTLPRDTITGVEHGPNPNGTDWIVEAVTGGTRVRIARLELRQDAIAIATLLRGELGLARALPPAGTIEP